VKHALEVEASEILETIGTATVAPAVGSRPAAGGLSLALKLL
jgi:hypothetical protein